MPRRSKDGLLAALALFFLVALGALLIWINVDELGLISFATATLTLVLRSLRGLGALARKHLHHTETELPVR